MAALWPASLPDAPLEGTFREQAQDSVVRSPTEVGPGKQRRRSTATVVPSDMQFLLTQEQRTIFDAFYRDDLASGTLRFLMAHPMTGATKTWRFSEEPSFEARIDRWWMSAALTRLD